MSSNLIATPSASRPLPRTLAYPWNPDQGDGTYRNPIICADYSDPDVARVGRDFYLTSSSFNCTPGLPILHSRDLIHWKIINHAVKNLPHLRYAQVQPGCGIWAPAICHHDGKFWIFFATPDEGIYRVTATDPAGEWTDPHLVQEGKGLIDPCPLWDQDGKAYLAHAYAGSRAGIKHILRIRPMEPDGSRLLSDGKIVFHSPDRHPTVEGPKFYRKDGYYYIFAPAGGVATGWQLVLRSRNIYGPYEEKIVLHQGNTAINGPHQGALIDLPNGEWWFMHFQDTGPYGRIVHLQPVQWRDGWPLIGEDQNSDGIGEPVTLWRKPDVNGAARKWELDADDEFADGTLGLQWQWQANHKRTWYALGQRKGWLRLFSEPLAPGDLTKCPNLLLQKFPARSFEARTLLSFSPGADGDEAGLVVTGGSYVALALRRNGNANELVLRHGANDVVLGLAPRRLELGVVLSDGGEFSFRFSDGNNVRTVPGTFKASAANWMGAKIGLYSLGLPQHAGTGFADFDYFRFAGAQL
jgi:beta-xylosidase